MVIEAGQLVPYYRHPTLPTQIEPGPGDVLLILDAAWNNVSDYPAVMGVIKARGGRTIVAVYDTLPLTYPALFNPSIVCGFRAWRERIVLASDAAVAISRATGESLAANLRGGGPPANLPIGWWPLGADFAKVSRGEPSEKVARIASGASYFLSVGTLEPRKGYPIAIDAFERLWGAGVDTRYVIVGRPGWNTSALQERLLKHKEFNRRLLSFENATDADLHILYSRARGAVLCSVAEGFGLPLIEAAFHGVPVIASDIPVFGKWAAKARGILIYSIAPVSLPRLSRLWRSREQRLRFEPSPGARIGGAFSSAYSRRPLSVAPGVARYAKSIAIGSGSDRLRFAENFAHACKRKRAQCCVVPVLAQVSESSRSTQSDREGRQSGRMTP